MMSPVPYGCVITSLTVVNYKMSNLPRMTCAPAMPTGKSVQCPPSKPSHKAAKAYNTQRQLSAFISVLHQGTR